MTALSSDLPLHLIGTRGFLPALLAHIRNLASPTSLPLDHVIFQSILLCLIAGDKHLILRTPEEDVGLTVKLVVWTLSCVFSLPTQKLKIRNKPSSRSKHNVSPATDPSAFLRSLFLQSSSSSNSNQTSQDEGSGENLKLFGHHLHQRQRSGGKTHKHKPHHEQSRSRSFPNNLAAAALAHGGPLTADGIPGSGVYPVTAPPSASPSILKPQPIYPNRIPHAYTEPVPLRTKSTSSKTPQPVFQLPQALVVSGLEQASDAIQRSLAGVLGEKRVVLENETTLTTSESDGTFAKDEGGTWNLPEGFITVYVCPWSTRERPALHKSLLDKFAMSANVFVPQNVRRDFHLLPFSSSSSPVTASRPFHPNFVATAHSNPGTPVPSFPVPLPALPTNNNNNNTNNTPPMFTKTLPLHKRPSTHYEFGPSILPDEVIPPSFIKALQDARHRTHISYTMSLYLSDIFSATRHNSRLDAMLLTARAMRDAEDLVRASRVIGNDLTGMELVRRSSGGHDGDDGEEDHDEDVNREEEEEEEEGASFIGSPDRISKEYVRLSADHNQSSASQESVASHSKAAAGAGASVLDVTEVNVARIVPRVISHRVRLRNGPEDEVLASALFGATFKPPPTTVKVSEGQKVEAARSVKAILVSILSEV